MNDPNRNRFSFNLKININMYSYLLRYKIFIMNSIYTWLILSISSEMTSSGRESMNKDLAWIMCYVLAASGTSAVIGRINLHEVKCINHYEWSVLLWKSTHRICEDKGRKRTKDKLPPQSILRVACTRRVLLYKSYPRWRRSRHRHSR